MSVILAENIADDLGGFDAVGARIVDTIHVRRGTVRICFGGKECLHGGIDFTFLQKCQ